MYDMHETKGRIIFCLTSWLFWSIERSAAQTCIRDMNSSIDQPIKETSPEGYLLLNLTVAQNETWSLKVKIPSPLLGPYFNLTQNGTSLTLVLAKVYDLEEVYAIVKTTTISFVIFELSCTTPAAPSVVYSIFASVEPVNEFAPAFVNLPENGFNVSESAVVNSTLLMLRDYVEDRDVQTNPAVLQFTLVSTMDATLDGRQKMALTDSVSGGVFLSQALDYEAMDPNRNYFILNLTVGDREGLTSSGTVRINVIDADDQPPEFVYPGCARNSCSTQYVAAIADSFQGEVAWLSPAPIAAQDQDTMGSPVGYRFKQGEPDNYGEYIAINGVTGAVTVLKSVAGTNVTSFRIIVEAVERTLLQHSAQTLLWLMVVGRNDSVPTLPPDPVVVEVQVPTPAAAFFRLATIVLGVLLGVILVLLVVVVLCCVRTARPSAPVLSSVSKSASDYSVSSEEPRGTEPNGSAVSQAAPERRSSGEIERSPSRNSSEHHYFASRRPYSGRTGSGGSAYPGVWTTSSPVPSEPREDYNDGAGLHQTADPAVLEIPRRKRVKLQEPEVEEQEVSFEVEDLDMDVGLDHEAEDAEEPIYARPAAPRVRPDVPDASPHLATISGLELHAPGDLTQLVTPRQAVQGEQAGLSNPVYNDIGNGEHVAKLNDRLILV